MSTLYSDLGGDPVIERIVDLHYQYVMADPQLARFFEGIEMSAQRRKFQRYLHTITDGPLKQSKIELRAAHARAVEAGLDGHGFDAFAGCFNRALADAGINSTLAERLREAVQRERSDVLGG
jgi:hemoglobin